MYRVARDARRSSVKNDGFKHNFVLGKVHYRRVHTSSSSSRISYTLYIQLPPRQTLYLVYTIIIMSQDEDYHIRIYVYNEHNIPANNIVRFLPPNSCVRTRFISFLRRTLIVLSSSCVLPNRTQQCLRLLYCVRRASNRLCVLHTNCG